MDWILDDIKEMHYFFFTHEMVLHEIWKNPYVSEIHT